MCDFSLEEREKREMMASLPFSFLRVTLSEITKSLESHLRGRREHRFSPKYLEGYNNFKFHS